MAKSMNYGIHCSAFDGTGGDISLHPAAPRQFYLAHPVENGHFCPITMTHAAVGALRTEPHLFEPGCRDRRPRLRSGAETVVGKPSVTLGMGMTERQGGTDVRANITRAASGDHVEIVGHKWFMSAPMCDAFLVLARRRPVLRVI